VLYQVQGRGFPEWSGRGLVRPVRPECATL